MVLCFKQHCGRTHAAAAWAGLSAAIFFFVPQKKYFRCNPLRNNAKHFHVAGHLNSLQ